MILRLSIMILRLSIMTEHCYDLLFMPSVTYAECHLCWVSALLIVAYSECHLCWVSFMLTVAYAECLISHIAPLCWVSLCWMLLCWVSRHREGSVHFHFLSIPIINKLCFESLLLSFVSSHWWLSIIENLSKKYKRSFTKLITTVLGGESSV